MNLPYETARDFRNAIKDRLRQIARETGFSIDELQRQFAYDRALARVFAADDADRWVLKGAGALLARLVDARHSKDIDVFYTEQDASTGEACDALRQSLDHDIGDYFGFEILRITALQEEDKGSRVHVRARLGATTYASFHIDVVVGTTMTGQPDAVSPLTPLTIDGLLRPQYRAFPVVDHLADKYCAIASTYQHDNRRPSTRTKDLVDVALIATTQTVAASALRTALLANAARRGLSLPAEFAIPDPQRWAATYPRAAADSPRPTPTYTEAVAIAAALFNPILAGQHSGTWDPISQAWIPGE